MGFKVDSSFLKYLTMGAVGVRHLANELRGYGFEPIELERYGGSNKIWMTKVKRLRLPDLMCVRTGLRAEVRAKSDLKIRMSDAPNNADRVWDAGMRDHDVVALVPCNEGHSGPEPAGRGIYFSVRALRESVQHSRLGAAKSASEGAERDREWPATIPTRPGRVDAVEHNCIRTTSFGDGKPSRSQTYQLRGKHPYVAVGDRFEGRTTIIAGVPASFADLTVHLGDQYDPLAERQSASPLDRYAAVKALRYREDLHREAIAALEDVLAREDEVRVALEAAGSATALGSQQGRDRIVATLENVDQVQMSMEAILILTELGGPFAQEHLRQVAGSDQFRGDERRQAAIWGLGKAGVKAYQDLIPYIADPEENTAFHAISAFGPDAPKAVIETLVALLLEGDPVKAAAASEALRLIGGELVLECLLAATQSNSGNRNWVLATMGRLSPELVRRGLAGTPLLDHLEPMLLLAPGANWLADEDAITNMTFLRKQHL